jgi:hypothetical protein
LQSHSSLKLAMLCSLLYDFLGVPVAMVARVQRAAVTCTRSAGLLLWWLGSSSDTTCVQHEEYREGRVRCYTCTD